MKHHIIETTKTVVDLHPEIMDKLKGMARWMAEVHAVKVGEAPDDNIRRQQEKKLQDDVATFLQGQLKRIIKELNKEYKAIQLSFWDDEERKMWSELSGDYVTILISALNGGINTLPPELSPLVDEIDLRQRLIDFAATYRNKWPKKITEVTMRFINETIFKWQDSGDPLSELIKTLSNPDLGMFNEVRAELIATTEVTRLHALGNKFAWEQTGYIKEFRWNTANDERVCQICGPRNYKQFPLSFIEDNMPAHPRCRCWATPVVDVEAFGDTLDFTLEPGEYFS